MIPFKLKLLTTFFNSRIIFNKNKRPRSIIVNIKRHININKKERKYKLKGVNYNIYLRAID
jgi:hypothetical protein